MEIVLIILSVLLIATCLLQSGKAENMSQAIGDGNEALFANRKERGGELFITRLTVILGIAFFIICLYLNI